MKAISLWQPWASLIAISAKPYETRSWSPPRALIGQRIAIHAAQTPTRRALEGVAHDTTTAMLREFHLRSAVRMWSDLPLGAIVCTAVLYAAYTVEEVDGKTFWSGEGKNGRWSYLDPRPDPYGDYSIGRRVWWLTDVNRLAEPVPCRGRQGFFPAPPEAVAAMRAQGVTA